jgi:hypothetical protein
VTKSRTHAGARPQKSEARPVSKPGDRHEREADRAADVVARGGSVAGWSFSAVAPSAPDPIQRQDEGKPKSDDDKKKEAAKKAGEALLETKPVQELKDRVLADPGVKKLKDAATSPAGIAVGTALAGGAVAGLAAAHKPLPFQPPSIPLDKITPGLSGQVKLEGPVDKPTFVGLTLTYKEQGPKGKKETQSDRVAADVARLKAEQEMFKPAAQKAAEQREADELVQAWIRSQRLPAVTVPLTPGKPPETPEPKAADAPKKDEEAAKKAPAQPAPAGATHAPPAEAHVDDALATPGRPLDPATRRSMEARFGYDFSGVRVHDDARAAATAAGIDAAAFTVGDDLVFGAGRFDPSSPAGRRLLAHELAHVVQQSRRPGGAGPVVQRRSVFESLGILLGIVEGTWEDRELQEYLAALGRTGNIEGSYDSDNKARAVVRRWKSAAPGFDLRAPQKILLIREMLDGFVSGGDEEGILDLLELSDASDLRAILGREGLRLPALESRITGDNRKRLDTFVAGRFEGGRDAVAGGTVLVKPPAVPTGAPVYDFDPETLDTLFDSDRTADELVEIVARFSPIGRKRALHHLSQVRRKKQHGVLLELQEKARALRAMPDDHEQEVEDLRPRYMVAQLAALKTERVLLHFYLEAAPASRSDLEAGTVPTDPARADELREVLHPPVQVTAAGTPMAFQRKLPGEDVTYDQKVYDVLVGKGGTDKGIVDAEYEDHVVGRGTAEHADPTKTQPLAALEALAKVAQDEVLTVFGRFLDHQPPPLKADQPATAHHAAVRGNIHDLFADVEAQVKAHPGDKPVIAEGHLRWLIESKASIARINTAHNAVPNFNDPPNAEAKLLKGVIARVLALPGYTKKLVEIERNWPGSESPDRSINVQIFRGKDAREERDRLWDQFVVFIHEVLHTLVNVDRYEKYANSLPESSFNTLIEGVCSFLTEVVWTNIEPRLGDHDLRLKVEGPAFANQKEPPRALHPGLTHRYASYEQVLQLVDMVAVENLYAAYFMGLIDRIGGVLPAPAHAGGHHP